MSRTNDYQNYAVYADFGDDLPYRPSAAEQEFQEERKARYMLATPYVAHIEALACPEYLDELAARFIPGAPRQIKARFIFDTDGIPLSMYGRCPYCNNDSRAEWEETGQGVEKIITRQCAHFVKLAMVNGYSYFEFVDSGPAAG